VIGEQRVVVVFPAYNAEKTLEWTYREIPFGIVDQVILVDDGSSDRTVRVAERLGIDHIVHRVNKGYGGNQKTCYRAALEAGADIVVMVHPDYQYSPRLIPALAHLLASGHYDVALGSRILGRDALRGGMPPYKYVFNRGLTLFQNLLTGEKLSEYHTGFRAFTRRLLAELPLEANHDDFIFDNQMLAQAIYFGFRIGEVSCPTRYFAEASSIPFRRALGYGLGVIRVSLLYRLARLGLHTARIFRRDPEMRLRPDRSVVLRRPKDAADATR
jgi:glycosyltransferase involved in cell wall biosynthesis